MGKISDNEKLTLNQKIEKLELYCHKIENAFNEVKLWTNPQEIDKRIQDTEKCVFELGLKMNFIEKQINNITPKTIVHSVDDKQLKELWQKSGVKQKQVAEDFNVSMNTAAKYCNGEIKDLMTRHNIKAYFLNKISVNKSEINTNLELVKN